MKSFIDALWEEAFQVDSRGYTHCVGAICVIVSFECGGMEKEKRGGTRDEKEKHTPNPSSIREPYGT